GSSRIAWKVSPALALALDTAFCKRTATTVPAGTVTLVDIKSFASPKRPFFSVAVSGAFVESVNGAGALDAVCVVEAGVLAAFSSVFGAEEQPIKIELRTATARTEMNRRFLI